MLRGALILYCGPRPNYAILRIVGLIRRRLLGPAAPDADGLASLTTIWKRFIDNENDMIDNVYNRSPTHQV